MQTKNKISCTINFAFSFAGFIVQLILSPSHIIESRSAGGDIEVRVPRGEIKKGVPYFGTPHESKYKPLSLTLIGCEDSIERLIGATSSEGVGSAG